MDINRHRAHRPVRRLPLVARLGLGLALTAGLAISLALPLSAQAAPMRWGPRAGFSANPDQVVVGAHLDFGEIARQLGLRPNIELGLGDHVTTVAPAGDLFWLPPQKWQRWQPYLGGELAITYAKANIDYPPGYVGPKDDSNTDLGLMLLGGVQTDLSNGKQLLLELKIGLTNTADLKLMAGLTF